MPTVTLPCTEPQGPLVHLLVGVSDPRREVLIRNGFSVPDPVLILAQIDTGSGLTGIDRSVLKQLEFAPHGKMPIRTPSTFDEPHICDLFLVSLVVEPKELGIRLPLFEVIESPFDPKIDGCRAMIGRDVLRGCVFTYDGKRNQFSLSS
jgi:hypothetical protein